MRLLSLILLMLAGPVKATPTVKIIHVADYGVLPGSLTDAVPGLQRAIAACVPGEKTILVFSKGRYDLWSEKAETRNFFISNTSTAAECPSKDKKIGLLFENKSDITIEGNGSLLVFHGRLITWAFDHCRNIRLRNVEIDYQRPTMSEMKMVEVSDSRIKAVVHPDSKFSILKDSLVWEGEGWRMENFFGILVNPGDSTFHYSDWAPFMHAKAEAAGGDTVLFQGDFKDGGYLPGTVLTLRDPIRDHVGVFINLSKKIFFEHVTFHYMHGLGIVSQFSEDLHFAGVQIVPSHGRQVAAFADCMHFSGCRGAITIRNCHFKGSHDDDINVHGTQLPVTVILAADAVRLRFGHGQTYGFQAYYPGDTVHFVHHASLQTFASGIVAAARMTGDTGMELRFIKALPAGVEKDDCVENISRTPTVTIGDCLFESTNTRGILVTTPRKVVIDHNVFSRTGMAAILIADDASSWFESGPVNDVSITHNTFIRCGYNLGADNYTIAIAPENHQLVPHVYVHRHIRIEENTFNCIGQKVLQARSCQGLSFSNNRIFRPLPHAGIEEAVKVTACDGVVIRNNTLYP